MLPRSQILAITGRSEAHPVELNVVVRVASVEIKEMGKTSSSYGGGGVLPGTHLMMVLAQFWN